jgi:hypothetical protein
MALEKLVKHTGPKDSLQPSIIDGTLFTARSFGHSCLSMGLSILL